MSHHHHTQPESNGAQAPQVAVRDGNRLLCPCCGEVLLVLAEEVPEERAEEPAESEQTPRYGPIPHGIYSPWDAIAARQDAAKQAAWAAFHASQNAKQEAEYAQFLASDDPKFCADYLSMPIDPAVAAYEFPTEDPPPLPSPKKPNQAGPRQAGAGRKRNQRGSDVPLHQPLTYQEKRYLAWTYYHLKLQALELQEKILAKQAKIDCLRQDLGGEFDVPEYEAYLPDEALPVVFPHVEVVEFDLLDWMNRSRADERGVDKHDAHERGPPTKSCPLSLAGRGLG
ncbi:hypothetical protein AB1K70_03650 [Bremerella sp. JC770]|uniref:hypothetical protein n=1 Tax=Bremerella sp. JC770 TaxID=3232137 RepID=UPI00345781B2